MRSRIKFSITAAAVIAGLAATATTVDALARSHKQRPIVVVRPLYVPPSPYAPYYYSPWNPFSIYSIYDHLSGGRQQCQLPSEPCDNNHRVQN
jgi:hypothetical protein